MDLVTTPISVPMVNLDDPALYLNRELSWLEFNRRVLEEAQDPQVPLLERLKFLAIFDSNLDEFFMVRVGGLQQKVQAGIPFGSGADRTTPKDLLEKINQIVRQLAAEKYHCFENEVRPALEREGVVLKTPKDLTEADRKYLKDLFTREIFPVLTPLAIDPGHPFPRLMNKTLNLAVLVDHPQQGERRFAVVPVPSVLPRFVVLPRERSHTFIPLEAVIRTHLSDLFPGMTLLSSTAFRVIRNSDFEIEDDEVEDLLKTIEEEIRKRRRGAAVGLQIEADAPAEVEQFLANAFDLDVTDVYRNPSILDLTSLFQIHNLPGYPHLRDPQFVPQLVPEFQQASSIWAAIRSRDILLHHPYDSFSHVVDFIETAANDERVLAIKQTLYRTSSDSPIVKALQRAVDNGKQVTALIEIKARLDEERNVLWARELEKAGVHVVFGFVGLKTHCKVALVVRREDEGIRRYVHLASGNYNPQTARIYTDVGFFTCNHDFCEDVSALFNYLTGFCTLPRWRKLIVAPSGLESFFLQKIQQEIDHQKAGREGRILAKLNGLLEPTMVQALYRASQAGVKIDLICRGICSLRPGIPNVSENIRIVSIVDRFLEHSRVYYFGNGGDPQVYTGSADWMDRNLKRRVEVIFPIELPELKQRIIRELLGISLQDNSKARELLPDGSYRRVKPEPGQPRVRSQERFLDISLKNGAKRALDLQAPQVQNIGNERPSGTRRAKKRQTG